MERKKPEYPRKKMYNQYKSIVNGFKLEQSISNGCYQTPLNNNQFMINSDELAYISGKNIIICDVTTQQQTFISRDPEDLPLTSFNYYSKSDKTYFALGCQSNKDVYASVKIYKDDRGNKKSGNKKNSIKLEHNHLGYKSTIIDALFIHKGKYVVTLGLNFERQSVVSIYNLQKKSLVRTEHADKAYRKIIQSSVNQESFQLIGSKAISNFIFREEEETIDTQQFDMSFLEQNEYIMDAAFRLGHDRLGVITNKNHALYFKDSVLVTTFQLNPSKQALERPKSNYYSERPGLGEDYITNKEVSAQGFQATCITGMQNGFSVGFGGDDMILLLEVFGDKKIICRPGHMHKIGHPNIFKTINIHVNEDETYLAIAVQHSNRNIKQILKQDKDIKQFEQDNFKDKLQQKQLQQLDDKESFADSPSNQQDQEEEQQQKKSKLSKVRSIVKATQAFGGLKAHFDQSPNTMLGKIDIYIMDLQLSEIQQIDQPMEKLFGEGGQKGAIVDIAVCITQSKMLTLCEDKTLKMWDYQFEKAQPFKVVQQTSFPENPLSLDIHPLAFQVAVGCKECLKIYFPQEDEFKLVYNETLKMAHRVKYSQTGKMLACVIGSTISLYNPYNYQVIYHYQTSHSGIINNLKWLDLEMKQKYGDDDVITHQDNYLVSNCTGGVAIKWNIVNNKREYEHIYGNKLMKVTCQIYDSDLDLCMDCLQDGKIKVWSEQGYQLEYEMSLENIHFTCAHLITTDTQNKIALFGTSQGGIRCYNWPFDFKVKKQEYNEIICHEGPVVSIKWTYDYCFLIAGGVDGQISLIRSHEIYEEKLVPNSYLKFKNYEQPKETVDNQEDTEIFLYYMNKLSFTSKFSIDQKIEAIKELESRLQYLQSDLDDEKERSEAYNQQQLDILRANNIQKQKEHKEQSAIQLEDCDTRYRELSAKRVENKQKYEQTKQKMIQILESGLLQLYKRSDQLKEEIKEVEQDTENEKQETILMFKQQEQQQLNNYEEKLQELTNRWQNAEENQKMDLKKYEEVKQQSQSEYVEFMNKMEQSYINELDEALKTSEELRTNNSKHEKLIQKYSLRKQELDQLIKETKTQIKHLEEESEVFQEKYGVMNKQLVSKEKIINDKEQELKQFRSKNKHLRNFQNVYDYKVTSLEEERVPLIEHLGTVEKNIKQLYKELLDESNQQKQIDEKLTDSKENIKELKSQINNKNDYVQITNRKVEAFKYDIINMMKHDNFHDWFKVMKEIYIKTFEGKASIGNILRKAKIDLEGKDFEVKGSGEQGISTELVRQRDFMSKKIATISRLNKQSENDRDDIVVKVQNENTHLIRECNTLREERKSLKEQLGQFESALEIITKELTRFAYFEDERYEDELQDSRYNSMQNQNLDILDISEQKIQRKQFIGKTAYERYQEDKHNKQDKVIKKRIGGMTMSMSNPRLASMLDDKHNLRDNVLSQSISQNNRGGKTNNTSIVNLNPTQNDHKLINSLLKDIEAYNKEQNTQGQIYEKLKEKVSTFLYQAEGENSLTLPQISRVDKTLIGSLTHEETMLQNNQNSQLSDLSSINMTLLENNVKSKNINEYQQKQKGVKNQQYKFQKKQGHNVTKSVSHLPAINQFNSNSISSLKK